MPPSRLEHGRPRHSACRRTSTSRLWNFCMATWSWRMISVWSLRGSAMIAVPLGGSPAFTGSPSAGHVPDHVGQNVPGLCFVHTVRPLELARDLAVERSMIQELVPVVGVVELRVHAGALPVDGVEVVARRAEVRGGVGVRLLHAESVVSKVMSWSTNWPTKVNPDVSAGVGVLVEGVVRVFCGRGTAGVGGRLLFHGRTQAVEQRIRGRAGRLALEHEAEATLGRRALDDQVHAAQLRAVGRSGWQLLGRRRWHPIRVSSRPRWPLSLALRPLSP